MLKPDKQIGRKADTYRGARRNEARADRKAARAEKRPFALLAWRDRTAHNANIKAKIIERGVTADNANKAVSIALAAAGPLASQSIADHAYLEFYRNQPRTRAVSRIIRQLEATIRAKRAA